MRPAFVALIVVVLAAACTDAPTKVNYCVPGNIICDPAPQPPKADTSRAVWTATRPPSYDFTLAMSCFCDISVRRPVVIAVAGTTVTSRTYADDGTPFPAQYAASFPSIDGLFDMIVAARAGNAAIASATYDAARGYPLQITLDSRSNVADDELYYTISNFRVR